MKSAFVSHSLNIITNNRECDEKEMKKLRYGLEGLYSFVTKFVVILLINILIKTTLEFIIFHIAYALIRSVGFGLHAKTNKGCWIISSIVYILVPLLIKNISISKTILVIIALISSIIIAIFAPADTKKRPLIHKNKRTQNKIISIVICLLYLLLILVLDNSIIYCLTYALLFEAVMVNPLSYIITNQSFNNYKKMNV